MFQLHNLATSRQSRAARYSNPEHGGRQMSVFGARGVAIRVVAGRPTVIGAEDLLAMRDALIPLIQQGLLRVTRVDGSPIEVSQVTPENVNKMAILTLPVEPRQPSKDTVFTDHTGRHQQYNRPDPYDLLPAVSEDYELPVAPPEAALLAALPKQAESKASRRARRKEEKRNGKSTTTQFDGRGDAPVEGEESREHDGGGLDLASITG